jgi:hypothetical protein
MAPPDPAAAQAAEQAATQATQAQDTARQAQDTLLDSLMGRLKAANVLTPALDPKSPTGRAGGGTRIVAPGWLQPSQAMRGGYDTFRKLILNPLLKTSPTAFGNIRDRGSRWAQPIAEASQQVDGFAGNGDSTMKLLTNFVAGGLSKLHGGIDAEQVGSAVDRGSEILNTIRQ